MLWLLLSSQCSFFFHFSQQLLLIMWISIFRWCLTWRNCSPIYLSGIALFLVMVASSDSVLVSQKECHWRLQRKCMITYLPKWWKMSLPSKASTKEMKAMVWLHYFDWYCIVFGNLEHYSCCLYQMLSSTLPNHHSNSAQPAQLHSNPSKIESIMSAQKADGIIGEGLVSLQEDGKEGHVEEQIWQVHSAEWRHYLWCSQWQHCRCFDCSVAKLRS